MRLVALIHVLHSLAKGKLAITARPSEDKGLDMVDEAGEIKELRELVVRILVP